MILIDLNVILDVIQKREPHYSASAAVLELVERQTIRGSLAAHAITTIHFLVRKYQNQTIANQAIQWLLEHFDIIAADRNILMQATALNWKDFEDAVISVSAQMHSCDAIVTRNIKDFRQSFVPALTPDEFLISLNGTQ